MLQRYGNESAGMGSNLMIIAIVLVRCESYTPK